MVDRLEGHDDLGWPASLLVALVVLSPWPFGSAPAWATRAIAIVGSLAVLVRLALAMPRRRPSPTSPLEGVHAPTNGADPASSPATFGRVTLASLWFLYALALAQVIPLPRAIHSHVAPGSAAVWHPAEAAAVAVLGLGARPVSLDPAATLRWLAFSAGVVGLAMIASRGLRVRSVLLRASVAVVGGALLVAVYGLVARLLFGDKLYGFLAVPTITPFGPYVSKNHFAGYIEMAACLAVGLGCGLADEARRGAERLSWLESRRAPWIVAAWGAAAVLILAVPISLSRGGVISLAAGLAAFVAIRLGLRPARGGVRRVVLVVSALGVLVVVLGLLLPDEARERVRTLGGVDPSGSYRLGIWRDSLRLVAASPVLGSGFGAVGDALPRFKTGAGDVRVEHLENDYLELLCEGGLVAAALGAVVLGSLVAVAWRSVRDEPHRLPRALRTGAVAGLAAILVHSAVDFNLRLPSNALLAAFLLACVFPAFVTPEGGHAEQGSVQRIHRHALLAFSTLALALGLLGAWTPREVDTGALLRASAGNAGLRSAVLEREVTEQVQHRPADAYAWAVLAWLRLPRSPRDADALAAWAQRLDPQRAALRTAAQRVRDAAQSQPRRP